MLICGAVVFAGCKETVNEMLSGVFFTLKEAYENHYITRNDLLNIAYYNNGGKKNNEREMGVFFQPEPKGELAEEVEQEIKEASAYLLRTDSHSPIPEAVADDFSVRYLGEYHGCYAIVVDSIHWSYVTAEQWRDVDGVNFFYGEGYVIEIWSRG